MLVLEERCC